MVTIHNLEVSHTPQILYDSFNSFILSDDRRVFNKMVARTLLYNQVKDIPGDIVECGVFKGTGIYTFLKLKNILNANSSKKVIGFDFFDTEGLLSSIDSSVDRETMNVLFKDRDFTHSTSFKETLENQLQLHDFKPSEFELIQGDVSITSKQFAEDNPGFKISLLYMDLDLEQPTYNTLNNLWSNMTKGGIVVFDEYGYHKWSESRGVDLFIEERGLQIKSLDYACPTAYIVK
jgi:hypothetical protein